MKPRHFLLIGCSVLAMIGWLVAWLGLFEPRADPDQIWRRAEDDFLAGRYDRARTALVRLERLRVPTSPDWMLRAQLAMVSGQSDDALDDLGQVADAHPLGAQAKLLTGQIELRQNRMRPAEVAFLEAIRLDPKLVQAHRELIYLYGVQLRRKELGEQFLALSEIVPLTFDNVFHWCLTRTTIWEPQEIAETMTRFLKADPTDRWSRLALARSLRQLRRLDEAARALEVLPASDAEAREIRVGLALDRGDEAEADALLAEGATGDPVLTRLRGRLALSRRDGRAALRHFRYAYALAPDDRETLSGLAAALTMVGDDKAAAPFLHASRQHDLLNSLMQRAATKSARDDPELLRQLGAACESIHELALARAWYNLAIAKDPLDKDAQTALFRVNSAIAAAH